MSASTHETTNRTGRTAPKANEPEHTGNGSAPSTATSQAAIVATGAIEMEIDGYAMVSLVRKFAAGMVMTEDHAFQLDTFYARQFRSNQAAMTANRAKALEKAENDADRNKAQAAIDAASTAKLLEIWATYEPNVGNTRTPNAERIKLDAAKRYWSALVATHNKSIMSVVGTDGKFAGKPVIAKAGMSVVNLPKAYEKDGVKVSAADQWASLTARLITLPEHEAGIAPYVEAIMAENGKAAATKADTASVSSDSLI